MYIKIQAFDSENNMWQDVQAKYPINFTNALDMNFDSGVFNTINVSLPHAYTRIKLFVGDSYNNSDTFYFYATASEQWRPDGNYQCEWRLIEPSKELQGCFIDGLAFTKNKNDEKSLFYVISRVLRVTPLRREKQAQKFYLTKDNSVTNVLQQTKSPQYMWGSQTSLWEVLCDIGAYIDAIPRLTYNEASGKFNVITFDFINKFGATADIAYYSRLINTDEEQYCSQLETNVQNLVVADEEEGSIVFPAPNAFATPRTADVKLTDKNCQLILDKDIAEIEKFYLDASQIEIRLQPKKIRENSVEIDNDGNAVYKTLAEVLAMMGNHTGLLDATSRLYDSETWQTLKLAENQTDTGIFKETTTYYTRYTNTIELVNTAYKGVYDIFQTNRWKMFLNGAVYDALKEKICNNDAVNFNNFNDYRLQNTEDNKNYFIVHTKGLVGDSPIDLRDTKFRVVYKPVDRQVKLRVGKKTKPDFQFVQPYNQRAEINVANSYGKNMQGVVNRMGVENMTVTEIVYKWKDVKKVGDVFIYKGDKFIITTTDVTVVSAEIVRVVYYLSKNWNMLSQYFNVDKKFTNWNIPVETTLRNLYYNDKCTISSSVEQEITNDSSLTANGIKMFMGVLEQNIKNRSEVNNMQIYSDGSRQNIVNAASFGFGNSIVFTAAMKDNVSAGMMRVKQMECADCFYTDDDGRISLANISFGGAVMKVDEESWPSVRFSLSELFRPNALAELYTYVKLQNLVVEKDPAEILSMTYQLSIETENDDIIVGNSFASKNPLCKQMNVQNQFKVWQLTKKISPLSSRPNDCGYVSAQANFLVNLYSNYATLSVTGCDGVGWAITDENDNLLIACNNNIPMLYFTFSTENNEDIAEEQPITVTYIYQSVNGNILSQNDVEIAKGEQFELDLSKQPEHYKKKNVYVDGVLESDTVFQAMQNMTIRIVLEFVPFTREFQIINPLTDGVNFIEGLKAGAETIIEFFKSNSESLFSGKWLVSWAPVTYEYHYFAAVVWYRTMYAPFEENEVYGLAEIGDEWTVPKSTGIYSGSGGYVSQNLLGGQYPTVDFTVTVENDSLKIDVDAGNIYDANCGLGNNAETWKFSRAAFQITKISQKIEEEWQL